MNPFKENPIQPPKELLNKSIESKDMAGDCPNCKANPCNRMDLMDSWKYFVDGEEYPLIYNRRTGQNDLGFYDDWLEFHICHECGVNFHLKNGAYK